MVNKNKGITLIALIVSIIVLLILTGVTIKLILGEDGIITQSKKTNFYTEMLELKEEKEIAIMSTFISNNSNIDEPIQNDFLESNLEITNINELDDSLKAEIIFVRNAFGTKEQLTTKYIWNNNLFECRDIFSNNDYLSGLTADLIYVNKTINGKNRIYLYDQVSDILYKIKPTTIGGKIVHSLEYAQFILDGINSTGIGIIDTETTIVTASDGTKYYEPDLRNFSSKTEIVFYSTDFSKEKTMDIKEFINKGKPNSIEIEGQTYYFANYISTESSGTRVWANVRTNANGLEANWIWIPRYAYKLDQDNNEVDTIFVDINDNPCDGSELPENYVVHEAFHQKDGLKGIWFSKYQPSPVESVGIDEIDGQAPDLTNFDSATTKLIYYTEDGNCSTEEPFSSTPAQTITKQGETYYFYSYQRKIWANVKTTANGVEANWVWIPRYAYKLESGDCKVILIDINDKPLDTQKYGNSLPNGYVVHEAFTQGDGLKGIWFSKYQPSPIESVEIDEIDGEAPDLTNFDSATTKLIYYTEDGNSSTEEPFSSTPVQTITKEGQTYYFYSYQKKIWANVKTTANGLEANWVWIPRYAYKLESGDCKVILIDTNDKPLDTQKYGNSLPNGYVVHEAFTQGDGLKGIWFSKYQPSQEPD